MKKIISLILSCAVLASLFSFPVNADTGTSSAVAAPILYESFDSCDLGSYGGKVIKPEKSSTTKVVEENGNRLSQITVTSEVGKAASDVFSTGFLDFSKETVFSFDIRNAASSKGSIKADLRPGNGTNYIINLVSVTNGKIKYLPNTGNAFSEDIADTDTASVTITFNQSTGTICAYRGNELKTKVENYKVSAPSLKDFDASSCIFRFQTIANETPEGENPYTVTSYIDNILISNSISKTEGLFVSHPTLFYDTTLSGTGTGNSLYPVSFPKNGYNMGKVKVINNGEKSTDVCLVMAHKSQDELKSVSVSDKVTLLPNTAADISSILKLSDVVAGDILDFYFIDSITGLIPLTFKTVIEKSDDVEKPLRSELSYLFTENGQNVHPRVMATAEDFARIKADESLTEWKNTVIDKADKILDYDVSTYIRYETTGDAFLFMAQRMLDYMQHLGMAYQLTGNKAYANKAYDFMEHAASFKDWNPPHFLSTAEMTAAYAIGYDWMYQGLGKGQRQDIEEWVYSKGLLPGQAAYNGTGGDDNTGWWKSVSHNWNVVCNGGLITGAAAFADVYPDISFEITENAVESLKLPMKNFAPDGAWFEGYAYLEFMLQVMSRTVPSLEYTFGTDFSLMYSEGLNKTGDFLIQMVGNSTINNFHDAGASVPDTPELMWLADVYNKPVYGLARINSINKYDDIVPVPADLLFYSKNCLIAENNLPLADYFRGTEYVSLRSSWDDESLYLSYHGGKVNVNHGHADCGTFVLDALGERWACDIGAESYSTDGYFGSNRYLYYRSRAEGHNTLVIDPDESAGQDMDGDTMIESNDFESSAPSSTVDLTSAYASKAEMVKRTFSLTDNGSKAIVTDTLKLRNSSSEIYWFMHTQAEAQILNNTEAILTIGEKQLKVTFNVSSGNAELALKPAEPMIDLGVTQNSGNSAYKKLQLKVTGVGETVITVTFTPVTKQ
ncbi:MAG: heparinase II/III family protein [Clostridia bacterium]|nr:heparinase II/III family protein [Clostridia bacterium]